MIILATYLSIIHKQELLNILQLLADLRSNYPTMEKVNFERLNSNTRSR